MKQIVLLAFVLSGIVSCKKSQENGGTLQIIEEVEGIKSATWDWSWTSVGFRKKTAMFTLSDHTSGLSGTTANSLINTTGMINPCYSYTDGNPNYDDTYRVWVVYYKGKANHVQIKWNGTLTQQSGTGSSTVDCVFQIYEDWPIPIQNNYRPQVGAFDPFGQSENQAIAQYETTIDLSDGMPLNIGAEGEYDLEADKMYRMQLYTNVYGVGNSQNQYGISNGKLEVKFLN